MRHYSTTWESIHSGHSLILTGGQMTALFFLFGTSLLIVHRMVEPVTDTIRPMVDTDSLGYHGSALKHRVLGISQLENSRKP